MRTSQGVPPGEGLLVKYRRSLPDPRNALTEFTLALRSFAQQNSDRPKVLTPHLLPSPISSSDFVLLGKAALRNQSW